MMTGRIVRAALSVVALAAVVLGVTLVETKALGQEAPVVNPGVVPPHSRAYGRTYGEWSAQWWKWAFSIPSDRNPVGDTTGEFAGEGQSGLVWFLAGTWFGMGPVTRTCTVPAGKALFFPLVNTCYINFPETEMFPADPWGPWWEEWWRGDCAKGMDATTAVYCEIDGAAVVPINEYKEYRVESPVYYLNRSECDVLVDWGLPVARYGPCVADGYFMMLFPLPLGQHTIYFRAEQEGVTVQEVTYDITVVRGWGHGWHHCHDGHHDD